MFNQPLVPSSTTPSKDSLAPGLLPVLQQAVALRLGLIALAAGLLVLFKPLLPVGSPAPGVPQGFAVVTLAESALLLGLVTWPWLRNKLGRWFLPLALGWLLVVPFIQNAVLLAVGYPMPTAQVTQSDYAGLAVESVWLVIPVVLAAWQYGRAGWLASVTVLAAGQVVLLPLARLAGVEVGFYLVSAAGRLTMIALLGYVVLRMVTALQAEHRALQTANRQLAQRAATVEQLAESRERNRLARELHDTLAHSLTGISVQLQAVDTLFAHDPAAAQAEIKEVQTTVRSGIQESRRAIQALRATPLEDLGLPEALRQLCRRQAERTGVAFTCDIDNMAALDPLTEQAIYRVAEAALANVEQHSAATQAWVSFGTAPAGGLRLEVRDNGVGFDPAEVAADRFGLSVMNERAALIGATLRIASTAGQGTSVVLETSEAL